MQEESCDAWCSQLTEVLDSAIFTHDLAHHIDNCEVCSHHLTDYFDVTRKALFKIMDLNDEEARELLELLDAEDIGSEIVV